MNGELRVMLFEGSEEEKGCREALIVLRPPLKWS
jgi:hypothetical protein